MNCREFENVVVDIARGKPLAAELNLASDAHLGACVHCREWLAEQKRISAALLELTVATRDLSPPQRLEHRLRSYFRDQHASAAAETRVRRREWRYALAALGALFAVLLAVQGAHEWPRSNRDLRAAVLQSAAPARDSGVRPTASSPETAHSVVLVPLLYSADPWTAGTGPVVRMQLPIGVLGSLGYPVSPIELQARVTADVWLGEDGVARAIRLVSFESTR
jgi:predicted anti-sigma-YlaC factor YlaD